MPELRTVADGDIEFRLDDTTGDSAAAEFTAYASVFNNTDSYGDVVQPGAFAKSLSIWEERGAPIPLLWGHNMDDPDYNIGHVLEASEDDHGLKVRCALDLKSPKGQSVHRLLKSGRVREMSFAFSATDTEYGRHEGDPVRFVKSVDLYEVSVVPLGANPKTSILSVRASQAGDDDERQWRQEVLEALRNLQPTQSPGQPGEGEAPEAPEEASEESGGGEAPEAAGEAAGDTSEAPKNHPGDDVECRYWATVFPA